MIKIELSPEEKALLKEYLKTSPLLLIRLKCHALLTRSKGMDLEDIADIVSRDERTVRRWLRDFTTSRMASVFTGHESNQNASKLTKSQKEEVRSALEKPPSAYDLPKEFWDVPILKQYIKAAFGVVYESDQSYHFLLRFSDLSFKYPATFDLHRDEKLIKRRMEEIHKEIKPFLEGKEWEVFASDEVRMELEALTRRAWLKRGEKTVIKVERRKESQSYVGFLNQKSFTCSVFPLAWQNQEEILKALKELLSAYPNKRLCVVWDNAAFHKGKKIKEALSKGGILERVHLINLPPYAPDKNPIEHVWKVAKDSVANIQYDDFEKTRKSFADFISGRLLKYQI